MKYKSKFLLSLVVLLSIDNAKGDLAQNILGQDLFAQLATTQAMEAMKAYESGKNIDKILFVNSGNYYYIEQGSGDIASIMYRIDASLKSKIYADSKIAKISDEVIEEIKKGDIVSDDQTAIDSIFGFVNKRSADQQSNLTNLINALSNDGKVNIDDAMAVRIVVSSGLNTDDATSAIDSSDIAEKDHLKNSVKLAGNSDYVATANELAEAKRNMSISPDAIEEFISARNDADENVMKLLVAL